MKKRYITFDSPVVLTFVIINIAAFCLYGIDKSAAIKQKQRIPNKVLLGIAVIGGSIGALAGMYTFRHKTKKWYFNGGACRRSSMLPTLRQRRNDRRKHYTITVPVILTIQIAAVVFLLNGCGSGGYTQISQEEAMQMTYMNLAASPPGKAIS